MLSPAFSSSSRDAKKLLENPFKPPKDNDIFELRSREKEQRKMELQRQLGLKVHEKVTYAGRVKVKQANLRRILCDGQEEEEKSRAELQGKESRAHLQILPAVKMAMIKDRNIDKESISEFIIKKREMFLLEYSLAVKYGEIAQLEKVAAEEERKLMQAEMLLEKDNDLFDEFLKENDKNSVEAIKIAEQETKAKLERIAEIKRITTKIVAIKSDISKFEDILKEYTLYKDFLFKLSPPEWQEAQRTKANSTKIQSTESEDKEKTNEKEKDKKTGCNIVRKGSFTSRDLSQMKDPEASSRLNRKSTSPSDKANVSDQDSEASEYEAQPELYFTDPQQLLDLLTELEEQNLSLIQNSRETEEALEDIRYTMDLTQKKMLHETEQLTQQIDVMNQTILRERERATELELRSHLFNYGNYNSSDDQEGLLDTLGRKVEEVYRSCVGDNEGNLSTLLMLTAIEGRLGELLENAEMIPRDRLLLAERAKDKERRLRLRDEKIREQKKHQEERLKRALERAQADIKKATGKKLMTRSQPPVYKQKKSQENPLTDKEMEEHQYFFT